MRPSRRTASTLSITSGSPPGLALVITSTSSLARCSQPVPAGRPAASWNSSRCSGAAGSISPSVVMPGVTPGSAAAAAGPCSISTIGRSADSSSAPSAASGNASGAHDAMFATMTAKGFSSRALRSRSRATAAALRASQASWKPPSALIATISPARKRCNVAAIGSSTSTGSPSGRSNVSCGPQTGQAFGCAWKRRSSGSLYSRWHAGHCLKRAMLVFGRS